MSQEPKFQHSPIERLSLSQEEARKTEWYQWKYAQLSEKYEHGIADAGAIAAYRSSAYADDDWTNDAEGRWL